MQTSFHFSGNSGSVITNKVLINTILRYNTSERTRPLTADGHSQTRPLMLSFKQINQLMNVCVKLMKSSYLPTLRRCFGGVYVP